MKRFFVITILAFAVTAEAFAALNVTSLRVNRMDSPCGVDPGGRLSFSWMLSSDRRNTMQTAYEIEVKYEGASVWKSGKVLSDRSLDLPCPIGMLSGVQYDWYVRVWDNFGRVSAWAHGHWLTGLAQKEWKAAWLEVPADGRAVYFRRKISLDRKISRATAFISAKGIYLAGINGVKIGDDLLTPGWTAYDKRIQYQVYDVTPLLARGENEIRAELSQGWYSGGLNWGKESKRFRYGSEMAFLMQVKLEFSDGTSELICTDKSWEQSYGPVQFANIYDGQTTDFNRPFGWSAVSNVQALDPSILAAPVSEAVRRRGVIRPVKLIKTPKGESVIDFGQNLTGWEKVRLSGNKGDTVRIFHAEILDNDGNFYTANLRYAKATSTIVLSGGEDVFEPVHTFYGFRYIRVDGLNGEIDLSRFEAVPISSSFDDCGSFECSDSLINRLQHNILWSFRDNFVDVPTDCPQRDERLGWTGDAQVFFRTATFLGRVENFFRKWLRDLSLDQRADGGVPRVIPDTHPKSNNRVGATGWADCATLIPWQHYMAYGDLSILENQYPSMKAWVDYCISQAEPNGWLRNKGLDNHYGDWLFYSKKNDPDGQSAVTSKALIAQAFLAGSTQIVADAARLTGREDDAKYYDEVYGKVVKAFRNEYITPSGRLMSDTQTAYVLALHFNLVPDSLRQTAVDYLVENIHRYKDHITTGFLGTPHICQVLTDNGRPDVAYTLLMQDSCPSWIYPALHGATTIWERWDSINPDGTITGGMNSFNHYSFGAIGDWLYRSALGIRETRPGYRTMEINPHAGGGITYMKGGKQTPYGLVEVEWTADKYGLINCLDVTVPAGTSATIHFQGSSYEVGSGNYHYAVPTEKEADGKERLINPVDFSKVKVQDSFWTGIIELNRTRTIPANIHQLEVKTEHIRHFELSAQELRLRAGTSAANAPGAAGKFVGKYYDDSDVYKAIEGIACSLQNHPDAQLEAKCDEWIEKIAAAQWPDGYLNTWFTLTEEERWTNITRHEMYCGGHLIEAAIAYYRASGKRRLLDVATRFADHMIENFGPGRRFWIAGHEEIELAMVKLFEVSGESRYLDFAKWLTDVRGTLDPMPEYRREKKVNLQDDIPVRQMRKASGHAVRAMYLYSGMSDVAAYTGDPLLREALDSLWDSVVKRNMYVTGGIGSQRKGESFGNDWSLPNKTAYCETCASVGMVLWNARMNWMYADSKYMDVLERSLYNGTLAGLGMSGDRFFYVNPLESDGDHHRREWYGTPCCPSNLCRLLPSVGGYIYGESADAVWVNLYIGSEASLSGKASIRMESGCPWDGGVTIYPTNLAGKAIKVRIPEWSGDWTASVSDKAVKYTVEKGYAVFRRNWKNGDALKIDWKMRPQLLAADPRVREDAGKRALQMGPLVYCCEKADNPSAGNAVISSGATFTPHFETGLLGGVNTITSSDGLKFIPYYAWDNREPGWMKVWIDYGGFPL